jgi:hypothetical protein
VLDAAAAQARDGAAVRAVDVELDQLGPVDAGGPGGVDLRDDAAFEFEDGVRRVVGGGGVGPAVLVHAGRDVRGGLGVDRLHRGDEVVEDVTPVREHVQDHAAAVLGPVVPARALRGLPVALEYPVAEVDAYGQDAAEEARVDQALELAQPRQVELVRYHAMRDCLRVSAFRQRESVGEGLGGRLLSVDVLAGGDRLGQCGDPGGGDLRVEVDLVGVVGEGGVQIGRVLRQAVLGAQRLQFGRAAPDQYRLGEQDLAARQGQPALFADGQDRADQVLAVAHATGHAVHDDVQLAHGDLRLGGKRHSDGKALSERVRGGTLPVCETGRQHSRPSNRSPTRPAYRWQPRPVCCTAAAGVPSVKNCAPGSWLRRPACATCPTRPRKRWPVPRPRSSA